MHVLALVLSILLAIIMLGSGVMKLVHAPRVVALMEGVNVSRSQMTVLGLIELAATFGLLVGIWLPPLAIAAAIGVIAYFAGAIIAHVRAGDPNFQGAIAFLLLAAVTLAAFILGS